MKLLPVAILLSCTLAFAQTPAVMGQAKAAAKAEAKVKADKATDRTAAKVDKKTGGQVAEPVDKAKGKTKEKVAAAAGEVVANKDSKVFHKPTCKLAAKIKPDNKATLPSKAEAVKAGYTACKICKP